VTWRWTTERKINVDDTMTELVDEIKKLRREMTGLRYDCWRALDELKLEPRSAPFHRTSTAGPPRGPLGEPLKRPGPEQPESPAEPPPRLPTSPLVVSCPRCGVGSGIRCVSVGGRGGHHPLDVPHAIRRKAARRWLDE
jgi:hypothetical protein